MAEIFIQYVSEVDLESVWNELSDIRKSKINRLKAKDKKLLSVAAELALNKAVRAWFPDCKIPVKYEYDENGKPYLTEHKAYINLSHSGDIAVCAISENEIGVDIQKISTANMDVAKRFFSETEIEYINNSPDKNRAFFEAWSKKEAYVKMTGKGISKGFFEREKEICEYKFHRINGKDYIICTCERKKV